MKLTFSVIPVLVALATSSFAADAAKPDADQLLRGMSAKLGAARSFTFEATREVDASLAGGTGIPRKAQVAIAVQRPGKLSARAVSKEGTKRLVADGRTFSMLDEKMSFYATVPMKTTIDGLVERLDEKYGFVPPIAEFVVSDVYAELRREVRTVTYLGRGKASGGVFGFGGIECHRVALKGKIADAELWIGVEDQLPHKLVATFRDWPGKPELNIQFKNWDLAANVPSQSFVFTPPKGALKINMKTTAEIEASRR